MEKEFSAGNITETEKDKMLPIVINELLKYRYKIKSDASINTTLNDVII